MFEKTFDVMLVVLTLVGLLSPFFLKDFMWSFMLLAAPAGAYVGHVVGKFLYKHY